MQDDSHLLTVLKYIERNPVRAQLAQGAEDWRWSSAFRRMQGSAQEKRLLADPPTQIPRDYKFWINDPEPSEALKEIRHSITKGVPYGGESWREHMVKTHSLGQTLRSPGRPKSN